MVDLRPAIAVTIGLFMLAALAGAVTDFVDRGRYDPVTTVGDDLPAGSGRSAANARLRECTRPGKSSAADRPMTTA